MNTTINPQFGNVFEDVGDAISDGVDAVGDVVTSIPGVKQVAGAVDDFVSGPMRDFARTGVGEVIFRAASVALQSATFAISPLAGQTIGYLAWAVPGLARGEKVDEAFTKEFIYRVEYCASFVAGKAGEAAGKALSQVMAKQLAEGASTIIDMGKKAGLVPTNPLSFMQAAIDKTVNVPSLVKKLGLTAKSLAAKAGIREDVAAYLLGWVNGMSQSQLNALSKQYDPETGKAKGLTLARRPVTTTKTPIRALPMKTSSPISVLANPSVAKAISTLAGKTAVTQATAAVEPDSTNAQLIETAKSAEAARSTKLGIAAGLGGAVVGTGAALLSGLSATIAAPIGVGFGIGSGLVTKILSSKK
jgi:hypothetical protein